MPINGRTRHTCDELGEVEFVTIVVGIVLTVGLTELVSTEEMSFRSDELLLFTDMPREGEAFIIPERSHLQYVPPAPSHSFDRRDYKYSHVTKSV